MVAADKGAATFSDITPMARNLPTMASGWARAFASGLSGYDHKRWASPHVVAWETVKQLRALGRF